MIKGNDMRGELRQDQLLHYTLYGSMENRGGRVIWALEELGLPYRLIDLQLFKGEQRHADYLKINPQGKVPALVVHREENIEVTTEPEIITESLAILLSLADRHSELLPQDSSERARCFYWLAFTATELEPPLWTHSKHSFVYPEKRRVSEIFPSCLFEFQKALNHIESSLSVGNEYLLPSGFSVADIFLGQTLMWGKSRGLGELGESSLTYLKRLKARPAWQRALATRAKRAD